MWKLRSVDLVLLLSLLGGFADGQRSAWKTLSGDGPLVIARGGFSGLLLDSSFSAYSIALSTSLPNTILWCDVQLTKDSVGICFPSVNLDNSSDISSSFPNKRTTTYVVNGVPLEGLFAVDFTFRELEVVSLTQGLYYRTPVFDAASQRILTVEEVRQQVRPSGFWLNIQHGSFYGQHNLSMRSFVISVSRRVVVNYISSPEVGFLRSIVARFNPRQTKLVFRFLGKDDTEPSTNQTYDSLLKNLTFIKTFAYGILVPKSYIQPVDSNLYVQSYTSLVSDAHKAGLAVFASDFANDVSFAYNYSFDPVAEYLSYIDGEFSVDGVLSDFPITASSAIDCFSHMHNQDAETAKLLVISSEGASGDYPGCTDLAYNRAISDGVDVLDCPVQLTQDGVPFCLGSVNLVDKTNVAQTEYGNSLTSIRELNSVNGFYAFNLSWSKIQQDLKPLISSPYAGKYKLFRNPDAKSVGKFMSLSDILALAKNANTVSGVLISIENAAYLAQEQGLDVISTVIDTLNKAGYSNLTQKNVMIQSTDSSVLKKLKSTRYELVYEVHKDVRDITNETVSDIKSFASSVVVNKRSVFPDNNEFVTGVTDVVAKLQAFNLPVYVKLFRNEYESQSWDFFSDAYVELNNFFQAASINGVVTEFPATANKYRRNRCLGYSVLPPYMSAVEPGLLLHSLDATALPPAEAPNPVLTEADVVQSPVPSVVRKQPYSNAALGPTEGSPTAIDPTAGGPMPKSGQGAIAPNAFLGSLAVVFAARMLS